MKTIYMSLLGYMLILPYYLLHFLLFNQCYKIHFNFIMQLLVNLNICLKLKK
jgi:hypothetical protein